MNRFRLFNVQFLFLFLFVAACSPLQQYWATETPTSTPTLTPTATKEPTPTATKIPDITLQNWKKIISGQGTYNDQLNLAEGWEMMMPLTADSIRNLPAGEPLAILGKSGKIVVGSNIEPAAIAAENGNTVVTIKYIPKYEGKQLVYGRSEAWVTMLDIFLEATKKQYQKGNTYFSVSIGTYDSSSSGQIWVLQLSPEEIAYFAPIIAGMPEYFYVHVGPNYEKKSPSEMGISSKNWIDVLTDPGKECHDIVIYQNAKNGACRTG